MKQGEVKQGEVKQGEVKQGEAATRGSDARQRHEQA